jgi:hypothetical protein
VATATANAANANPGFRDNDLIILASFHGLFARSIHRIDRVFSLVIRHTRACVTSRTLQYIAVHKCDKLRVHQQKNYQLKQWLVISRADEISTKSPKLVKLR